MGVFRVFKIVQIVPNNSIIILSLPYCLFFSDIFPELIDGLRYFYAQGIFFDI